MIKNDKPRIDPPINATDFGVPPPFAEKAENFARWAIAQEREACKDLWEAQKLTDQQISDHIKAAVAAEREACAKVCEDDAFVEQWKGLSEAARRIRARGSDAS